MKSNNLFKKSILYFIGNFSTRVLTFALLPIYAYFTLPEELGDFDFTVTIVGVLAPIVVLGLWESLLRYVIKEKDSDQINKAVSTILFFSISTLILSIFILILINNYAYNFTRSYSTIFYGILGIHTLVIIWQYYARAIGENTLYVVSGILTTIINVLLIVIFIVVLKMGLIGLLLSYFFSRLFNLLVIEYKVKLFSKIKLRDFNFVLLKTYIRFSLPLVANLVFAWVIQGFGKVIILEYFGNEANGLYAFASKFSLLIVMIGSVFSMALIEENILNRDEKDFASKLSNNIESLITAFIAIGILLAPVITIFYIIISNTGYVTSFYYVPLLLIYSILLNAGTNVGTVFQAIDKTKYQFISTLVGAIATVIGVFLLIDYIDVYAVIVGQIFGALAMLIYRVIYVSKFIQFKLNYKKITLYSIVFIATYLIMLPKNLFVSIISFVIFTIIVLIKYNKLIRIYIFKIINWRKRNEN